MSPAAISPVTRKVAGESSAAPATSAAWTAYSAILEVAEDGSATAAGTAPASTHHSAAASSRLTGASGVITERIAAWYSSTVLGALSAAAASGVVPDVT